MEFRELPVTGSSFCDHPKWRFWGIQSPWKRSDSKFYHQCRLQVWLSSSLQVWLLLLRHWESGLQVNICALFVPFLCLSGACTISALLLVSMMSLRVGSLQCWVNPPDKKLFINSCSTYRISPGSIHKHLWSSRISRTLHLTCLQWSEGFSIVVNAVGKWLLAFCVMKFVSIFFFSVTHMLYLQLLLLTPLTLLVLVPLNSSLVLY